MGGKERASEIEEKETKAKTKTKKEEEGRRNSERHAEVLHA